MDINGTYTSANGDFALTITNHDPSRGTFGGTYVSKQTPQGQQTFSVAGNYSYVNNPGGSRAPLNLAFTAAVRPDNRPYCILDSWSGVLTEAGKITATGVRSHLRAGGQPELSKLGTHSLSAQPSDVYETVIEDDFLKVTIRIPNASNLRYPTKRSERSVYSATVTVLNKSVLHLVPMDGKDFVSGLIGIEAPINYVSASVSTDDTNWHQNQLMNLTTGRQPVYLDVSEPPVEMDVLEAGKEKTVPFQFRFLRASIPPAAPPEGTFKVTFYPRYRIQHKPDDARTVLTAVNMVQEGTPRPEFEFANLLVDSGIELKLYYAKALKDKIGSGRAPVAHRVEINKKTRAPFTALTVYAQLNEGEPDAEYHGLKIQEPTDDGVGIYKEIYVDVTTGYGVNQTGPKPPVPYSWEVSNLESVAPQAELFQGRHLAWVAYEVDHSITETGEWATAQLPVKRAS